MSSSAMFCLNSGPAITRFYRLGLQDDFQPLFHLRGIYVTWRSRAQATDERGR